MQDGKSLKVLKPLNPTGYRTNSARAYPLQNWAAVLTVLGRGNGHWVSTVVAVVVTLSRHLYLPTSYFNVKRYFLTNQV